MLRIEKKDYSFHPWRLVDENGDEIWTEQAIVHPMMGDGLQFIPGPVCGPTKESVIAKVLEMLEKTSQAVKLQREEMKRLREGE